MTSENLITSGTQVIQTLGSGLYWVGSGIGGGISVIVGKTGLYETAAWARIAGVWSKFAPFLGQVANALKTGYGIGAIFSVVSLWALDRSYGSIRGDDQGKNKSLTLALIFLVGSIASGMLAYVAFTYGTALVTLA